MLEKCLKIHTTAPLFGYSSEIYSVKSAMPHLLQSKHKVREWASVLFSQQNFYQH